MSEPAELKRLRLTLDRYNTELLLVGDRFEEGGRYVQAYMGDPGATWLDYDEAYDRLAGEWQRKFGAVASAARGGWSDGTCAACGRSIRVWDGTGQRRVLLDSEPADDGDTIIQPDGTPIGVIREDVAGRFTLYRSHFFSCPKRLAVEAEVSAQ
jgi:hypothetical protein